MYTNYLQYKCFQYGVKEINIDALKDILLWEGVFSEEVLHEMWDKQKFISSDNRLLNMLDYPQYRESIRNINTGNYDEKINQKGISKICQKAWSKLVAKIKKLLK